ANYNGAASLTILTSDLGNTGSGGTLTDTDVVAITVNAVNDAPVATVTPISYSATEQVSLTLHGTGLSISDIDAGSSNVQATLSVTSGTLTVSAGTTGVSVSGSTTSTITLTGTLTQINNLLAGNGGATLSYIINSDAPPASDTLTLLASDLGNTGSGGTLTSSDTAVINITAVNDAPTVAITAPSYTVVEAQSVLLHNTGLSVADPDGNSTSVQVTLSADIGTITIAAGTTGVTVGNSGTGSVTLTGTVSQINNLLLGNGGATIGYINNSGTPTASATLTLAIDDLGNTGGGNLTASANVAINVVPAAAMGSVGIPGVAPTDIGAYYGFDTIANLGRDDSVGGHNMTLIGTPTAETGHDGRTSAFGVTNDETGAPPQTGGNIAGLSTGGAMTISLWVRFDAFNNASGGDDRIIDFGQAGATGIGNIVLARDATTQRISFVLQHDNVTEDICTTGVTDVVQTGQWAHIAATVDASGNMKIYFNGQLSGSFSGTALASGVRTNNYVAQSNSAGTYGMNGAIDDLLVANRAMAAGEIATLYDQANGFSVYEKASNGTSVGTVVDGSTIDGRTVTYSLANSAAGRFAINSSTGEITVADSANLLYTGASQYSLTVRATDSGGFALDTNYTVNLLNINDAPVGTAHTVGALEDTPYVFGTSDFGFTDPSDPSANTLLAVKITAVPASGSLTLNGVAVSANDVIQASDIAAGKLQFTSAANDHGAAYASFDFKVQDDGGTANGGIDMDTTARTMTIDVASVNDAPQGSDKTVTTLEDTPYVFAGSDFGFSDVDGNAFLAVKITSVPGAGSLTLNGVAVSANDVILASDIAAGRLQLSPVANASGAGYSSFGFRVQDDGGTANGGVNLDATTRTMTLDVTPVNDAPAGADKTVTTNEDTSYVFSASDFGFTDPDDSPANTLQAVKLTTLPASGTLTLNGSAVSVGQFVSLADINAGLLVFSPTANDHGTAYAALGFQVQDNGGTANGGINLDATTRTLTMNVTSVNDAPTTQDEAVSGNEDNTITGQVSGADVDGDSLSFSKGSDPTHGSVSVATNGSFSYTPSANYNGTDSFTVTVSDGQGGTATSTVTVTINPVNDAPTANNPSVSGNEDTIIIGQVTASDADNDPLGFSKASDPTHGSVTVNSDGSFSYTPTANYNGTDSFTVTVSDGQGGTTTSTINITVTPVNDAPTTNDVSVSGNEDSAISGQVTGADVDGNPLSYTKASDPTHGSVSVAANGNFVYTPNANYNGTDSFTVTVSDGQGGTATATVSVTIAAVNDAPTADNPGVIGAEDTPITGQVTGNDVDGDTLSYTKTSNPTHGSVTVNSDGSFSYTPTANFNGSDSFTVTVADGHGGTVLSTVSVTVTPVNDAPVSNSPSVSGAEDAVITGTITASDVEGDTLSYQVSADPAHGQVTVASDGSFSYTPTANYNGSDSFTVLVSDGQGGTTVSTVSVNITAVNDAPTTQNVSASGAEDTAITGQVSGNDVDGDTLSYTKGSDPTHGSVTVQADGSFSYTPTANFHGSDSFTVTVSDGQGGTATSTISITVTPVNDAPLTNNVAATGAEDTPITGQVSGSDVDGDTLSYTKGSDPTHGSITVQADGSFSYTPTTNFSGSDSFTVTVSDGQGGSTTSTVSITVTPVNDAPITYNISVSGAEDAAITGQVTGSDADGDILSYAKGSDPTHGSVSVNSDGSFSYTPTANFNGNDSFTVTVSDGQGGTATSTISINVTPVNDAPVTSNVSATGAEDTPITGQVSASDVEGDTLSYAKASDPSHGSVTVQADGSFSYTPTANYNGTDSFTVTVSDGQGGTATSTVSITVTALNDAPVTNDVSLTGAEDTPITGLVTGSDVDGNTLSYAKGSDPTHGSVSVNSDGSFSYTPTANFHGSDSFTVTVSDGQGGTATSTISINVTPLNDAPVTSNVNATGAEDTPITDQVSGSDVEGDTLSYAKASDPSHGSVTVQADGSFSYTPTANYNGTDSFTVTVSDGQSGSATSTVSITVTAVSDAPVMSTDTLSATAEPSVTWASSALLSGASDPDGGTLGLRIVQGPQHGTLAMAGNGQLTYTAASGYTGTDSFSYEAFDGQLASSNTRVMNIQASGLMPVAPALPAPPASTPSDTDNTSGNTTDNTTDNTTQDTTDSTTPPAEPSATEAKPSDSEAPAASGKTPPQANTDETEDKPATALHERVQAGAWLDGRLAEANAMGRQILLTGMSRDYFTMSTWAANGGNSTVIQLLDLIKPTLERVQDINLMLTPLSSVTHALPAQAAAETTGATHDEGLGQRIQLTKMASYSTGLGLSIGTIWWTARISGLVTSALISTPAWRSLDPLPVVTSPSDDPDHDEDGDSRLGDREVEHLFDGDKPIEQDMPVIQ
ncbi:tandem-95 repeat protein, partial [Aquabacterium sp.]|uniref:tandem-95 repeat protein n=1 Tax=Aquabacterium sp. TaxID=1872578 RepID=UPI004037A847